MLRSSALVHPSAAAVVIAHLRPSHRLVSRPAHAAPCPHRLARVTYFDTTRATIPIAHLSHQQAHTHPFTTTRTHSYTTSSSRSNPQLTVRTPSGSTTPPPLFFGGVPSSSSSSSVISTIDVSAISPTNGARGSYFLNHLIAFSGQLSQLESQIERFLANPNQPETDTSSSPPWLNPTSFTDQLSIPASTSPGFWSSVHQSYRTLLLDAMQSKSTVADILQLLHSWFSRVPIEVMTHAQRCQIVNEVIQKYYLQHSLSIKSKIGMTSTSLPTFHSSLPSGSNVPTSFEFNVKLKDAPDDLYRDIILRHRVLINLETVRLLCTHAAISKSEESTLNLVNFLRVYQEEMIPMDDVYDHHPTRIGVIRFSSSLEIDLPAFNSLLEIFGQYGDTKSAMTLFAELSPDASTTAAESISNVSQLLFKHLHPSNETYQALLLGYCRSGDPVGAVNVIQYMRQQSMIVSTHESSTNDLNDSRVIPVLSISTFEFVINSLLQFGHLSAAIEVLKSMEQPSQECFIPILLEIPRMKFLTSNTTPNDRSTTTTTTTNVRVHPSTDPFHSLPLADQFDVFQEIYSKFRSSGYILTEPDGLTTLIERVALWETGGEIRSLNPSTHTNASSVTEEVGWTERNLSVFTTPIPPHLLSKQFSGGRSKDYALSPILTDYIAHLDQTGQKPTIAFMNEMCYVFGVVLGNSTILNDFNELIKRYELVTNIHTLNLLMESYGRSGMKENVTFMYQQILTMMEQSAGDGGVTIAPNIQTINIVLNHTIQPPSPTFLISPSNTSSLNPFIPLTSLIADMQQYHIAPNPSTWTLILMKLIQLSGNSDEASGWLDAAGEEGGHTANVVNERPFTPLPTESSGLIWKIVHGLLLCAESQTGTGSVSSLTPHLLSQYLNLANKLNDRLSTFGLLQAMKESALSDVSPDSSDSTITRMLPHHFSLNYFTNRVHLTRHLHHHSLQFDWTGCRQLLQLWCEVGEQVGQRNGLDIEHFISSEHFAFIRLILDQTELQTVVKECLIDLSPASSTATPMRLHLSSCIFHSLIQYGHIQTAVDYLDQCARDPALRPLFPPRALTTLVQSIRAQLTPSPPQFDLRWMLEVIKRAGVDGPWAGLIPLGECLGQLSQLSSSSTLSSITSDSDSTSITSMNPSLPFSRSSLTLDDRHAIWLTGVSILGDLAWSSSSEYDPTTPVTHPSQLRYPMFLKLTQKFLQELAPHPNITLALLDKQRNSTNLDRLTDAAVNDDPFSSSGMIKRIGWINAVWDHHITHAVPINHHSVNKRPIHFQPSLFVLPSLLYSIHVGERSLSAKLIRHVLGRSGPGPWFTKDSELVPNSIQPSVNLATANYEQVIRLCAVGMDPATCDSADLSVTDGPAAVAAAESISGVGGPLTPSTPDPALAYEMFLQLRSEGRSCSSDTFRFLFRLQTCYPPIATATAVAPASSSSDITTLDSSTSNSTAASILPDPTLLGRNQLMTIWKYLCETRPWEDTYKLLPSLISALMNCPFHPESIEQDLTTKEQHLNTIADWTKKYPPMPLSSLNSKSTSPILSITSKTTPTPAVALTKSPTESSHEVDRLEKSQRLVEMILKTSHMKLVQLKAQLNRRTSLTPLIPTAAASSKDAVERVIPTTTVAAPASSLTDLASARIPATVRLRRKDLSISARYDLAIDHLSWPLTQPSESVTLDVLNFMSNRTCMADFLELTRQHQETGTFQRWLQRQPFYQSQLHSQLSGTSIFFLALLSFCYTNRKPRHAFRLLNAIHEANGLQLCFSDATPTPTPSPTTNDSIAPMTTTTTTDITPSPTSNSFLHMITSLLPRTNAPLSQWPNPPSVTVARNHPSPCACAEHILTREICLGDVNELPYCTLRSPSRWVAQLLYWHFHLNQLPTDAFHLDLLWLEPTNRSVPRASLSTTPPPDTYKINQYSITPRMIHGWVTVDGLNNTQALLEKCYLQTYEWFLHEIQPTASTAPSRSRRGSTATTASRKRHVEEEKDHDPFANDTSVNPSTTNRSTILQTYLHQLFKHLYLTYRSQMLATCQMVVPPSSNESSSQSSPAIHPLRVRSYRDLGSLEAAVLYQRREESDDEIAAASHQAQKVWEFQAREQEGKNPPNLVYHAFYQCTLIEPKALTSSVFNTMIASFVQFESSGLPLYTFILIRRLIEYMYDVLDYELDTKVVSYFVQAALEENLKLRSVSAPTSRGPQLSRDTVLDFALNLMFKHRARNTGVHVRPVSSFVTDAKLKAHFANIGRISSIRRTGNSFALIKFDSTQAAMKAIQLLNQSTLNRQKIQVTLAKNQTLCTGVPLPLQVYPPPPVTNQQIELMHAVILPPPSYSVGPLAIILPIHDRNESPQAETTEQPQSADIHIAPSAGGGGGVQVETDVVLEPESDQAQLVEVDASGENGYAKKATGLGQQAHTNSTHISSNQTTVILSPSNISTRPISPPAPVPAH